MQLKASTQLCAAPECKAGSIRVSSLFYILGPKAILCELQPVLVGFGVLVSNLVLG